MKKDIHPKYNDDCQVTCVCGDTMTTGSVEKEIKVELCSSCHPFYTGKQKLVDSARRVEKFETKSGLQEQLGKERKGKKVKTAARSAERAKKEVKVKADSFAKIAQVKLGK
ncbi:MAG: 50S ribosomal protein L31 [Patescibacteria group bacterium]